MSGYGPLQNNNTGVSKPGPPPKDLFPRGRTRFNNLVNPIILNNTTTNNIPPKDSNFLKRILVTLKTITDDNIYENVIFNYKKILKLPNDPSKLTNDDLRTFIPKRQNNTRKVFNYLLGKNTNNLNRLYSNKNKRTVVFRFIKVCKNSNKKKLIHYLFRDRSILLPIYLLLNHIFINNLSTNIEVMFNCSTYMLLLNKIWLSH